MQRAEEPLKESQAERTENARTRSYWDTRIA